MSCVIKVRELRIKHELFFNKDICWLSVADVEASAEPHTFLIGKRAFAGVYDTFATEQRAGGVISRPIVNFQGLNVCR